MAPKQRKDPNVKLLMKAELRWLMFFSSNTQGCFYEQPHKKNIEKNS